MNKLKCSDCRCYVNGCCRHLAKAMHPSLSMCEWGKRIRRNIASAKSMAKMRKARKDWISK